MKKLLWFTETNFTSQDNRDFSFDLTDYIKTFVGRELWTKTKYRTEYNTDFDKTDLVKIESVKIHFHVLNSPYSNLHRYEGIVRNYFDIDKIGQIKLASSGISDAKKIAVVEIDFKSGNKIIDELTYEEEKQIDLVFARLSKENRESWFELQRIKSIACEFMQFLTFNLHLNFLTHDYTFSFGDKSNPIGFTIVHEDEKYHYDTDKIELLTHYILYDQELDRMKYLMDATSKFWCTNISSIHFLLDSLKSNYVTSTNFIKLVFTLESFFGKNASNDFISLTAPLVISENINDMKKNREIIRRSFNLRNEIVHGNSMINFLQESYKQKEGIGVDDLFFQLKNIIAQIFWFYIDKNLFLKTENVKINHELMFELIPNGLFRDKGQKTKSR